MRKTIFTTAAVLSLSGMLPACAFEDEADPVEEVDVSIEENGVSTTAASRSKVDAITIKQK